jgi:FtsP/CotA-like multicopper oxidase with cupredoxin domain
VWKDTLWIKSLIGSETCSTNPKSGIYTVVVRTRYQRYIGEYVLHCHILDHEDQGMMQNVSIGLPNGQGGGATTGHH